MFLNDRMEAAGLRTVGSVFCWVGRLFVCRSGSVMEDGREKKVKFWKRVLVYGGLSCAVPVKFLECNNNATDGYCVFSYSGFTDIR